MHYPDQDLTFRITVDASKHALSYVLSNLDNKGNELPVFFGGRSTNADERKFSATDLELSALLAAVKAYEPYISGSEFQVKSDHLSLVYLNSPKFGNSRLVRASILLSQYKFKLLHTPGRTNHVADALSRVEGLEADALTAYQQSRHYANDEIELALEDSADIDPSVRDSVNVGIQCDLIACDDFLYRSTAPHLSRCAPASLTDKHIPKQSRKPTGCDNHSHRMASRKLCRIT